jgi:hypothetical protein
VVGKRRPGLFLFVNVRRRVLCHVRAVSTTAYAAKSDVRHAVRHILAASWWVHPWAMASPRPNPMANQRCLADDWSAQLGERLVSPALPLTARVPKSGAREVRFGFQTGHPQSGLALPRDANTEPCSERKAGAAAHQSTDQSHRSRSN